MRQRAGGCVLIFLSTFLLTSCAVDQAQLAARGRQDLVGLSQTDIRMCAGNPVNTAPIERGELWMYEHGAVQGFGIPSVPLPWGVQIHQPSGGYCRMQVRFVDKRVAEVVYAGATDVWGARDAACAPIVRTCVERSEQHIASLTR